MRFFVFSAVISAIVNAGIIPNNPITGYLNEIQNLETLLNGNPFMNEFDSIKDLLLTGKVNGVAPNVPEQEAAEIIHAVNDSKAKFELFITALVSSKSPEESQQKIVSILNELAKVDNLEQTAKDTITNLLQAHPEYVRFTQFTFGAMPGPVQEQVLNYAKQFFDIANQSDPAVATALANVLDWSQTEFKLFPKDFYTKLEPILTPA